MDCEKYYELISLYIDGMLSGKQLKELEKHIEKCRQCREEVSILQKISKDMVDLEQITLPDNFHKELMEKINENSINSLKSLPTNKKWYFNMRFVSAVAAVFIVSVILINPFKDNGGEEAMPEMANNVAQTRMMDLPVEDGVTADSEKASGDAEIVAFDLEEEAENINYESWIIETSDAAEYKEVVLYEIEQVGQYIINTQELNQGEDLQNILLELELDENDKKHLKQILENLSLTNTFEKTGEKLKEEGSVTRVEIIINQVQ